jgi:hypothetical protein
LLCSLAHVIALLTWLPTVVDTIIARAFLFLIASIDRCIASFSLKSHSVMSSI